MYMKNLLITYSEGLMPPRLTSTSPSETMDSVTFSSSSPIKQTPSLHWAYMHVQVLVSEQNKRGGWNRVCIHLQVFTSCRGGEWYLEKRGSRKILAGSRNLESIFDKSRNLVFAWFVFTFCESQKLLPKSLRFYHSPPLHVHVSGK